MCVLLDSMFGKIGEKFEVCYMYFVTEVDLRNILALEDGVTKIAL